MTGSTGRKQMLSTFISSPFTCVFPVGKSDPEIAQQNAAFYTNKGSKKVISVMEIRQIWSAPPSSELLIIL